MRDSRSTHSQFFIANDAETPVSVRTVLTDERSVTGARQELGVHQRAQDGITCGFVEPPQAARLLGRQP